MKNNATTPKRNKSTKTENEIFGQKCPPENEGTQV
jgi:hypothetical protein